MLDHKDANNRMVQICHFDICSNFWQRDKSLVVWLGTMLGALQLNQISTANCTIMWQSTVSLRVSKVPQSNSDQ